MSSFTDGDNDSADMDSEMNDNQEDDPDGDSEVDFVQYDLPDFRCLNPDCREGFVGAPACILPDESMINFDENDNQCEENSDCEDDETCLYTNPEYTCVKGELLNWVGLYQWTNKCRWEKLADMESDCAVVAAFEDNGRNVILHHCFEEYQARLCIDGVCSSVEGMDGYSLNTISNCDGKGTVLSFFDQYSYPYKFIIYRLSGNTLKLISEKEAYVDYWARNYYWSELTCNDDGLLIWMLPDSVNKYKNGGFETIFSTESLGNGYDSMYSYSSFDSIRFDADDPKILHIGAVNWGYSIRIEYDLDQGIKKKQAVQMEYNYPRSLVTGKDYWIAGDYYGLYKTKGSDTLEFLFTLGNREDIVGLTKDNLLLTKSFSRIFKYEIEPGAYPKAMDSGLPFALDYKYYVPSIRNVYLETQNGEDKASLYVQFRPTGENAK